MSPQPWIVAVTGSVDLNNVGAQIGQDYPCERPGQRVADFNHPDVGSERYYASPNRTRNGSSRRLNSCPFRSSAAGVHRYTIAAAG